MINRLTKFAELEEPIGMGSLGWYVACVEMQHDDYYLHDDVEIYDSCAARYLSGGAQVSTGWFKTEMSAYVHSQIYYTGHGLKYPFADKIAAGALVAVNTESQVMEFL